MKRLLMVGFLVSICLGAGLWILTVPSETWAQGKKTTGTLVGVVLDKGNFKNMNNAWVEIKGDGEESSKGRRYAPAADPKAGGPNREVLAAIRAVAIGSRVRIEWVDAGDGKDITKFEVLKGAK